jgi:hypothetical protein
MSKLILSIAVAAAALSVTGCKKEQANEANATMNAEEVNYSDNMTAEENMVGTNDMNMTNEAGNAAEGNATGNAATNNSAGY